MGGRGLVGAVYVGLLEQLVEEARDEPGRIWLGLRLDNVLFTRLWWIERAG